MIPPDPDEVDRFRADETGEIVSEWALHNHLVHDYWDVDRSRMGATVGESPDVWAVIDEDGEGRTFRRVDAGEDG